MNSKRVIAFLMALIMCLSLLPVTAFADDGEEDTRKTKEEYIRELKAGRSVRIPVYDYTIHNRSDRTILVPPNPVIILEGIMILAEPSLLELMDFKIFVDTDADERILRRIERDVKERERSLDSVIRQYRETVKPMHEQFAHA